MIHKPAGRSKVTPSEGLTHGIVAGRYYAEMEKDPSSFFDRWLDMNIGWIRIEFEEYMGDNRNNVPEQTARYRKIISEAARRGMRVLGVIGTSAMQDPDGFPYTDDSIRRYISDVEWHLQTYAVDAIEICNEPLGVLGDSGKRPECLPKYANALIMAYTRLKPQFPDVLFAAPVTANAEIGEWLGIDWKTGLLPDPEWSIFNNSAMQAYRDGQDGRLPLDVISWHPYGTHWDPLSGFYFQRSFDRYYADILAYKDIRGRSIIGDYPIWFTEYGWDTNLISEDKQKEFFENFFIAIGKYSQIKAAFLYTWRDDEPSAEGSEGKCHGLCYTSAKNHGSKPAHYSVTAYSSRAGLSGLTSDRQILDCYFSYGGARLFGSPADRVIHYGGLTYQTYRDQNGQGSAIVKVTGAGAAFPVFDPFYRYFFDLAGVIRPDAIDRTGVLLGPVFVEDGVYRMNTLKGKLQMKDDEAVFSENAGSVFQDSRISAKGAIN